MLRPAFQHGVLTGVLLAVPATAFGSDLSVVPIPQRPFIERRGGAQIVNFDLLAANTGTADYRLVALRVSVFDRHGGLELEREVNENGSPPAIDLVGERALPKRRIADLYQPFTRFDAAVGLYRMRFDLLYMKSGNPSPPVALNADAVVTLDVFPVEDHPAPFCLPLRGLVLVHDGHDFYSHHRRFNLSARYQMSPASAVDANLYANDLVEVTPDGRLFDGDSRRKESWLSYGQPVYAPAAGFVVEAVDGVGENTFDENGQARQPADSATIDPLGLGNHIKIRHADGRVSWLLHLQPGSLRVKTGDSVRGGQPLGRIGFTGDSLFPHLHYNVTETDAYPSQGVPVYFKSFARVLGSRLMRTGTGQIDTGDLVRSDRCE